MTTDKAAEERHHRGPMPPWPAQVDLIAWLKMGSQERAEHLRRHAEKEGHSEADTERVVRFWDHHAALLAMDSQNRAEQIRRDMEQAWAGSGEDEIERQTERQIGYWDGVAAAAEKKAR